MGSFMSPMTVSTTFFTNGCARKITLPETKCVFTSWTLFLIKAHSGKPMFSLFKIFFD